MPLSGSDLIVEDGTGKSDANAYVDLTYADAYHTLQNDGSAWASASTAEKVAAILRATTYVDMRWSFIGQLKGNDQALAWPRVGYQPAGSGFYYAGPYYFDGIYPLLLAGSQLRDADGRLVDGTVPDAVKKATAEYALRSLTVTLLPDPSRDELQVVELTQKAGPVEQSTKYAAGSGRRVLKAYPTADRILQRSGLVLSRERAVRG